MSTDLPQRAGAESERHGHFRPLLLSLALLALVYPIAERLQPGLRLDLVFRLAVLVGVIRALGDHPRSRWMLGGLGLGSLVAPWMFPDPASAWMRGGLASAVAFYATTLVLLVRNVFQRPGVTRDTLYGAACTYLLIALAFGAAHQCLEVIVPGSYRLPEWISADELERSFVYFSAVTLTTLGYGDIVPTSEAARSLVILESVIGVLYPSILIARVVSLYVRGDPAAPFDRRTTRLVRLWQDSSRFEALFTVQLLQIMSQPYVSLGWRRTIGAAVVVTALSTLPTSRRRLAIGCALGIPAVVHWTGWDAGWSPAGAAFLATFLFLATFAILEHLSRQREIDREVIFCVCCAYLMLGAAFAAAYQLVFELAPGEFSLPGGTSPDRLFGTMTYLSYVTLTTLGYGDVLPLDGAAHTLASLEAIIGILFPAILVAAMVSLYRLRSEHDLRE